MVFFSVDGSIHTGYHLNWSTGMDPGDKLKVTHERTRLGLGRRKKPSPNRPYQHKLIQGRYNPQIAQMANDNNQLTQLKTANAKYKRTIASLKSIGSEDSLSSDVEMSDAGNAFGV